MRISLPPDIREAGRADWRVLGDVTGEAFADDPVNRWAFGSPRAVTSVMRTMAREIYLRKGRCFIHSDKGATMWLEPGVQAGFPLRALFAFIFGMARYGGKDAAKNGRELGERMAVHHPKEPHMYLFTIGTTAAGRGKGVGKTLMRQVLEACDRGGVPVYLENSNPANHGFYRSHGFETVTKFEVGETGSPVMEPMWREAR